MRRKSHINARPLLARRDAPSFIRHPYVGMPTFRTCVRLPMPLRNRLVLMARHQNCHLITLVIKYVEWGMARDEEELGDATLGTL